MKLVAMSDTHNLVVPNVPDGDVLIHAGDATFHGTVKEISAFAEWYGALPHRTKLFVAGNHDWLFQTDRLQAERILSGKGIVYLQDSAVMISGKLFYGSPWQPEFCSWAFNVPRGKELAEKWARIPEDASVLITHGPPAGILDTVQNGPMLGCVDLKNRLRRLSVDAHFFGHIHDSYGSLGPYHNVASCDERYRQTNPPIVVDIP